MVMRFSYNSLKQKKKMSRSVLITITIEIAAITIIVEVRNPVDLSIDGFDIQLIE
jgi:hypothetical protein